MTDFSKPIQTKFEQSAEVLARHGDYLWISISHFQPSTWIHGAANMYFVNVPEPKTIFLREYANQDGIEYSDYRITLIPGQPPQIEEIKP